jgi:hypothetical protein
LAAGAVSMNVLGRGFGFQPGQQLLIDTQGATGADPPVRQIVQLVAVGPAVELSDPLFLSTPSASGPPWTTPDASPAGTPAPTSYTQITWQASDAITVARDLSVTTVCGNIVPATQGQRAAVEMFAIAGPAGGVPAAIVRTGPRSLPDEPGDAPPDPVPQHLYCLSNPSRLTWLGAASAASAATPEILVEQASGDVPPPWSWVLSILDAGPFDHSFTLDEARYQSIAVNSDGSTQFEYAGDVGDTIRFGTGTFGEIPDDGTVFQVTYRVGGGASGNVAAGAISQLADSAVAAGLIAVTNPLAASGGNDAETAQSVQRLAPQAFRAVQYRAVIPADYQAAAETLPWVQRAGTVFRWTGSWLTVLTTPDPMGSEGVTVPQQTELIDLLNRYRMAGYESYVPAAQYVSLDLELQIWAGADAFRGDVQTAVLARLNASGRVNGVAGFFDPDHFTFGTPLERSRLESRVQSAPGVAGVGSILFRVRNRTQGFTPMPDQVTVGGNQIIRCDNDPSEPEHGSIQITILGGK